MNKPNLPHTASDFSVSIPKDEPSKPTGLIDLDKVLQGIPKGELYSRPKLQSSGFKLAAYKKLK